MVRRVAPRRRDVVPRVVLPFEREARDVQAGERPLRGGGELVGVRLRPHRGELDLALRGALEDARRHVGSKPTGATPWLSRWYAPRALAELLAYRAAAEHLGPPYDDVVPFARSLVERFPDRVIWGADWPQPNTKMEAPDDGLEKSMRNYLATDWRHPPGSHRYNAADFGINRQEVNHAFAPYIQHFGVPLESA